MKFKQQQIHTLEAIEQKLSTLRRNLEQGHISVTEMIQGLQGLENQAKQSLEMLKLEHSN